MTNLISRATARLISVFKEIQVKQFVTVALVGFLVLTTTPSMAASMGRNAQSVTNKVDRIIHEDDSNRPKTTREWQQEAQRTEDAPVERIKEIGKESADAVQDFGELYPDVAKRSARATQENN
jgi:hypothetical protein